MFRYTALLSLKAPLFLVPISIANCVTHYNSTSGLPGTPGLVRHQQLKLTSAVCAAFPIRHQVEIRADRGNRWGYYPSDIFWLLESLTLTLLLSSFLTSLDASPPSSPITLPSPTLFRPLLPPLLPQLTAFSPLSLFPTLLSSLLSTLPSVTDLDQIKAQHWASIAAVCAGYSVEVVKLTPHASQCTAVCNGLSLF